MFVPLRLTETPSKSPHRSRSHNATCFAGRVSPNRRRRRRVLRTPPHSDAERVSAASRREGLNRLRLGKPSSEKCATTPGALSYQRKAALVRCPGFGPQQVILSNSGLKTYLNGHVSICSRRATSFKKMKESALHHWRRR